LSIGSTSRWRRCQTEGNKISPDSFGKFDREILVRCQTCRGHKERKYREYEQELGLPESRAKAKASIIAKRPQDSQQREKDHRAQDRPRAGATLVNTGIKLTTVATPRPTAKRMQGVPQPDPAKCRSPTKQVSEAEPKSNGQATHHGVLRQLWGCSSGHTPGLRLLMDE
jgi:hypothetical protein